MPQKSPSIQFFLSFGNPGRAPDERIWIYLLSTGRLILRDSSLKGGHFFREITHSQEGALRKALIELCGGPFTRRDCVVGVWSIDPFVSISWDPQVYRPRGSSNMEVGELVVPASSPAPLLEWLRHVALQLEALGKGVSHDDPEIHGISGLPLSLLVGLNQD